MGLLAAELEEAKTAQPVKCATCKWLAETDKLDAEDRAAIDNWIDNGENIEELWRKLRKLGMPSSVTRFRSVHVRDRHGRA